MAVIGNRPEEPVCATIGFAAKRLVKRLIEMEVEGRTCAALVMPTVSFEAVNKHLAEISQCVSLSAIALLIRAGVGWRGSPQLIVRDNIELMPLPPTAPELNSVDPSAGSRHLGV